MKIEQLETRALDGLKEFNTLDATIILRQFEEADFDAIENKSAFLCGLMKTYKEQQDKDSAASVQLGPLGESEHHVEDHQEHSTNGGNTVSLSTGSEPHLMKGRTHPGPDPEKIKVRQMGLRLLRE
jgi:hypothetical protein